MFFVKLCGGASWLVEGSVAEHGEQDADAVAGEAEEGLGVGFAAGSAAVVVAAGGGIVQGCERGEEHGSFQLPVAASGGACSPWIDVPDCFVAGASPA
ncbi:hypothetical protein GCM10020256_33640 [Streptomyces thermocoprophilus]